MYVKVLIEPEQAVPSSAGQAAGRLAALFDMSHHLL